MIYGYYDPDHFDPRTGKYGLLVRCVIREELPNGKVLIEYIQDNVLLGLVGATVNRSDLLGLVSEGDSQ